MIDNPFEELNREYVNHYSETKGIMFADSYDSFVNKLLTVIQYTLNAPGYGRELTEEAYASALRRGLTDEQWQQEKVQTMRILFFAILDACPLMKHEMAVHLYNELRKDDTHDE